MANIIRLKRRSSGGAAGAPTTLKTTEPAFNEVDNTLYLGYGDDGSGNATSIVPVGGKGAYADLTSAQTIAGEKSFSTSPIIPTPTAGDNSTKAASTAFVAAAISASSTGADTYQGVWNADTNSPALSSGTGTKGHRYVVSVAGSTTLDGVSEWKVKDWVVFNGATWDKVDNTDSVTSVNSQVGAVVLTKSDVGLGNVDNTSDATKNSAVATLTNKTLTSPVINNPTGIVKADVGLGNVDNTSDATKNSATATLTNKSLVDASTAIIDSVDGTRQVVFDVAGSTATSTTIASSQTANRVVTLPDATDTLIGRATTDTLTNKTLTSPVINTPTGIVKGDVGLGNVDNTSDATKNAATATLTNKTLTAPVINNPTGIVKADVGLGNVDNTSDATKNAATATLTNKTLTAPVINNPTGIVKADVGLGNVDNTSDATKNSAAVTLTNKTLIDNSTIIADNTDNTKQIKFDAAGSTATATTILSSQTANRTLTLPDATDTLIGRTTADTLTNKTLTSPVINTPTGIVKGDVGLGNVDNTSDATKNAATATLTNKTLTAPVINNPTGIVKADVGLGNVDNTSDATKNAATATLTNKTLTAPVINSAVLDLTTIDGGTF